MKTAILIHGKPDKEEYESREYPSPSNFHWFPWLQKELLLNGYMAQTPEMPVPYAPDYETWKKTFEQFNIGPESLVIGHSCGGGFLLRYFSENDIPVKKIILVAPWIDPDKEISPDMFDFLIDPLLEFKIEIHLLYSDNDSDGVNQSVTMIRKALPHIRTHFFKGYGHFCLDDIGSQAFPELLDIVLS